VRISIIGGGVFGLAAAWRLSVRGHQVIVHEAGEIPSEKAASRGVSKALRAGYGAHSGLYAPAVRRARSLWRELEAATGRTVYHETGCLQLSTRYAPGTFEHDGYQVLRGLGWPVELLEPDEVGRRYPAFCIEGLETGVLDRWAGWVDPMEALPALADAATGLGAEIRTYARVEDPDELSGDRVLVCAGAWLGRVVADVGLEVKATRQHEGLFHPQILGDLASLPAWSLDMGTEGWYGFPPTRDGVVKVARHLPDLEDDPDGGRDAVPQQAGLLGGFVARWLPGLIGAVDVGRSCFYTMSPDGGFLFDAVPGRERVLVAGCGGGHAFKFGPVLGDWATDLVEGKDLPRSFRISGRARDRVV